MKNKRIELLAHKWIVGTISSEEQDEFNRWYTKGLDNPVLINTDYAHSDEVLRQRILVAIQKNIQQKKKNQVWLRAVAALFVALTLGVGFYIDRNKGKEAVQVHSMAHDIAPGGDKATLVLADGRRIALSDAQNGKLAEQAGVVIAKSADGQLIYRIVPGKETSPSHAVVYNSIETPVGGQYQILLPDGTHVWLNAASSLRYPTSFPKTGRREVQLAYGEAYFDVSHDALHPFVVSSGRQQLEVMGTRFNVTAYQEDRQIKTTLLAGKVKISDRLSKEEIVLQPGQQALLSAAGIEVNTLDGSNVELWKDGKFIFDNESMRSIMPQIARWYKVKVSFVDPVEDVRLNGSVSRFENLSTLLEKLELTGLVRFKLEGDQLQVMKP